MIRPITCIVLSLAAFTLPARAEQLEVTLDPENTSISFELGATMHTVHGTFRLARGRILVDSATGSASGEVVVDATSGDSGNQKRDRDMHAKVLESARFSTILLAPGRVEGELPTSGTARVRVFGELELHGGRHPVEIPVDVAVTGRSVEITGEFEIPYVEWGLRDPSKFVLRVEKKVTVSIQARGEILGAEE